MTMRRTFRLVRTRDSESGRGIVVRRETQELLFAVDGNESEGRFSEDLDRKHAEGERLDKVFRQCCECVRRETCTSQAVWDLLLRTGAETFHDAVLTEGRRLANLMDESLEFETTW